MFGLQVWHELSHAQIFKVRAFQPHKHAAVRDGVTMEDEEHVRELSEEMAMVKDVLCNTRGWLYHTIDKDLRGQLDRKQPLQVAEIRNKAKLNWPRVCNLLQVGCQARSKSLLCLICHI